MNKRPVILIVDDEPYNISLLEQELDDLGYDTVSAANGSAALAQFEQDLPDLALLDIMMPGMDGFEVLSHLKGNEVWRHIPVVIISAMNDMASVIQGIELGADDYLPKPFDLVLLQARITNGLERKRLRDAEQIYLRGLEREMEIGRRIQQDFLPESISQPPGWEIAAHFQAAREVAGDFYDVFPIGDRLVGLVVGDVCDKGVGAALYMSLFRSLLRSASSTAADGSADGEAILRHAIGLTNDYVATIHERSTMFSTLFYAILDLASGGLIYANAGQEPALILNGTVVKAQLGATMSAIGLFAGTAVEVQHAELASGDVLLVFSDGIPDARSEAGDTLDMSWLEQALTRGAAHSARGVVEFLSAALEKHIGIGQQFDDITILAAHRAV